MSALARACSQGYVPAKIAAVISDNPDAAGLNRARALGIHVEVVDYKAYPTRAEFDRALLSACNAHRPDVVALAGFMRILSGVFVRPLSGKIINIHPSLLPGHAGLTAHNVHKCVLEAGDKQHGCSVHYVTEVPDAGPLIARDVYDVRDDDTVDTLAARGISREHLLYPYVVKLICEGRIKMKNNAGWFDGKQISRPLSLPS